MKLKIVEHMKIERIIGIRNVGLTVRGLAVRVALLGLMVVAAGSSLAQSKIDEAMDTSGLAWEDKGAWLFQTDRSVDGVDALVSAKAGDNDKAILGLTVTGPATLRFSWKVSSEEGYDFLRFYGNGELVWEITGEVDWARNELKLPEGTHSLSWAYEKDDGGAEGLDAGWLDQFELIRTTPSIPLAISQEPAGTTVTEGNSLTLVVQAKGESPLTYQWYFGTTAGVAPATVLSGQTSSTLTISAANASDSGYYRVRVSDPSGFMDSAVVTVTVQAKNVPVGLVADTGFRPEKDGFGFSNYGNALDSGQAVNLTPAEMRRMFGDRVVARLNGNTVVLTPPAKKWMEKQSVGMDGGHCEGMAVLSVLMYNKQVDPGIFGTQSVPTLKIEGNPQLQSEIGYWFVTQATSPADQGIIKGTPVEILDRLIAALKPGASETYTIGVYAPPGVGGGHAVTPYAVEYMGNDIYNVLVYDNNHPGKTRRLVVDKTRNTWELGLSINPGVAEKPWFGDANTKTLEIVPSSPRMLVQECSFCEETAREGSVGLATVGGGQRFSEIYVDGNGVRLLITDAVGRRYGFVDGVFLQEIPDVSHRYAKSGSELWEDTPAPVFFVPADQKFKLTLDGSVLTNVTETAVTLIGSGFDIAVEDIFLEAGESDVLEFEPDGSAVSYTTSGSESPDITLGFVAPGADYEFTVAGVETDPGATMNIKLDRTKGTLTLASSGNSQSAFYDLSVVRYDDESEQEFYHDEIELEPKDLAALNYGTWQGEADTLELTVDWDGDGTIDERLELTDDEAPDSGGTGIRLSAKSVGGGKVQISWSNTVGTVVLESNTSLGTSGWTTISDNQIETQGESRTFVSDTAVGGNQYYRLRKN
jgi:hypothetical protein